MDWGLIGGVATITGALIALAIYLHQHWHRTVEAQVADPAYRKRLIDRQDCTVAERYYVGLDRLLTWADRVYGPQLGYHAFRVSMTLAFVYPLVTGLIGWIVSNQPAPGGLEMFQKVSDFGQRLGLSFLTASGVVLIAISIIMAYRLIAKLKRADRNQFSTLFPLSRGQVKDFSLKRTIFEALVAIFAMVSLTGLAVSGALSILFSSVGLQYSLACIVGAFALGFFFAGAEISPFTFNFAAIAMVLIIGDFQSAALLSFLYLLLPLANATADWLSLAVTRALLRDMVQRRPGAWGLAAHLVLDLIAGGLCLALLLAGLVGLLELWARIHSASLPFNWRGYWTTARADPAQGVALWLMAFTTLLPTLVHAVFSLTLWQTQKSDHTRRAVAMMRGMGETVSDAARIDVARLILRGRMSGFLRATVYWGVPLATTIWVAWHMIQS